MVRSVYLGEVGTTRLLVQYRQNLNRMQTIFYCWSEWCCGFIFYCCVTQSSYKFKIANQSVVALSILPLCRSVVHLQLVNGAQPSSKIISRNRNLEIDGQSDWRPGQNPVWRRLKRSGLRIRQIREHLKPDYEMMNGRQVSQRLLFNFYLYRRTGDILGKAYLKLNIKNTFCSTHN